MEIGTRKPELVILDWGLSSMDDIEMIHKVRDWSSVPIIVLSAMSQKSNVVSAYFYAAQLSSQEVVLKRCFVSVIYGLIYPVVVFASADKKFNYLPSNIDCWPS